MSTFMMKYQVTKRVCEREFVATGEAGPYEREIEISLPTNELRADVVELYGLITGNIYSSDFVFDAVPDENMAQRALMAKAESSRKKRLEKLEKTVARIIAARRDAVENRKNRDISILSESERKSALGLGIDLAEYDAVKEQYDEMQPIFAQEAEEREREAEEREREAEEREREAEERENNIQAARRLERQTWINTHGSKHLQEAVAAGYDCQRLYVTERAAKEYPGYTLDFSNDACWQNRSCPSADGLQEAKRVGGKVVWLTDPASRPDDEWDADWFVACEAVAVKFLDRYWVYRIIS